MPSDLRRDQPRNTMIRKIIWANAIIAFSLAAVLLLYPSVRAGLDIQDPALRRPGIPKVDWRLMRQLSPRYAAWARKRVAVGRAEKLSTADISGTEWPLFGSVFYLWGIENLQTAWEAGDHTSAVEPKVFCKDAIIAASELWELPDGTLAMPRILSNFSDAPMLGEAAILWLLNVQPEKGFPVRTGGSIPTFVYVVLIGALLFGISRIVAAIEAFKAALREPGPTASAPRLQICLWVGLIVGAIPRFSMIFPGIREILKSVVKFFKDISAFIFPDFRGLCQY